MTTITPFLWYHATDPETIVDFYKSVFPDTQVITTMPGGANGKPMGITLKLSGFEFTIFNGGPSEFHLNESVSLFVGVETQPQVDELWDKLTADGGEASQCGWLKDKFGLSWQIVPTRLGELLADSDREAAGRAMQAMLKMKKIIIKDLEAAFNQA